jgi:glutamine synthetase
MISCFRPIGDTPFGALGDLMLVPDPATEVRVDFGDGSVPEHFYLGDLNETDGTPWSCCPRHFLKRGLAALEAESGLRLFSAFEQELTYTGVEDRPNASYALDGVRRQGPFAPIFMGALRAAGIEPDTFMSEYGPRQYEITASPALGVAAADQAVIIRELARATAWRLGHRASFTPIISPSSVGNGVHIHWSLQTRAGKPVSYDPKRPYGLSEAAEHFAAGLIHHMRALCAVTAPSTISYIRLTPNRWAPTFANIRVRDREASLRVCPIFETAPAKAASQFNVEFRPADAAASPYLALGAVVHAGLDGIRTKRRLPAPTEKNPARMTKSELKSAGIEQLPQSLGEALDALEATPEARDWFGPVFLDLYLRHKRSEIRMLDGADDVEQCRRYAEVY